MLIVPGSLRKHSDTILVHLHNGEPTANKNRLLINFPRCIIIVMISYAASKIDLMVLEQMWYIKRQTTRG